VRQCTQPACQRFPAFASRRGASVAHGPRTFMSILANDRVNRWNTSSPDAFVNLDGHAFTSAERSENAHDPSSLPRQARTYVAFALARRQGGDCGASSPGPLGGGVGSAGGGLAAGRGLGGGVCGFGGVGVSAISTARSRSKGILNVCGSKPSASA